MTPEEHAANPPSSWKVVRAAPRCWQLQQQDGSVIDHFTTRRAATEATQSGHAVSLYEKHSRWFAGHPVAGWRPYAEIVAERAAREARQRNLDPSPASAI